MRSKQKQKINKQSDVGLSPRNSYDCKIICHKQRMKMETTISAKDLSGNGQLPSMPRLMSIPQTPKDAVNEIKTLM